MDVCGSGASIARSEITLMLESPTNDPAHWRVLGFNTGNEIYLDAESRVVTLARIANRTVRYALAEAGFYIPPPEPSDEWLAWQRQRYNERDDNSDHDDSSSSSPSSLSSSTTTATTTKTQPSLNLRCFYCETEISFVELSSSRDPLQLHVERARNCGFAVSAMFVRMCTKYCRGGGVTDNDDGDDDDKDDDDDDDDDDDEDEDDDDDDADDEDDDDDDDDDDDEDDDDEDDDDEDDDDEDDDDDDDDDDENDDDDDGRTLVSKIGCHDTQK